MKKKYALTMEPLANPEAMVVGPDYRFTVLTSRLIRMEYQAEGKFVDEPTQTVLCRNLPVPQFRVLDREEGLEIITGDLHLYYDKKPFTREGLTIQMKQGFHVYGSAWAYGDEIYDLRGTAKTLDEADGAIPLDAGLLSQGGFTVLDDSKSAFIGSDQWPVAKDWESTDLYFFGYGHDYLDCLKDFYRISGPTPLLPRFALGNWWSRYYQYSEESYLALMDRFREKQIPFSTAVIDMDWHLVDIPKKYGGGWTGYTWNPAFFPDPKRFMDALHDRGMKITLNVHPADGVRAHEEAYLPMARELGVDYENEDKIPFDASNRAFLEAYFKYLHHPNEKLGVDFWWLDWQQGNRGSAKGIDTLWLLNHLHFLDSGREGEVPLTFSRYAGLGSHRYPVGFSGDTIVSWESLDFQPYFTANASNAGYSWWSHDIGGHMRGYRNDELVLRWVQLGVFSPIMRLHSSNNEFMGKEPWNYNLAAEKTMTEFLQLRHKLLPYLYTMNYLTHSQGLPLVQPMYYHHDVPQAYNVPNEYWFGTEMIVCPITKPVDPQTQLAEFSAWLPEGEYIDFFTGQHYRGGRNLKLYRDQQTIPVLVKAGGIIPMAKDFTTSHLGNPKEMELHVFTGADGTFDLYEDCGSRSVITRFSFTHGQDSWLKAEIIGDPAGIIPENRAYTVVFHGVNESFSGNVHPVTESWSYDKEKKQLTFRGIRSGTDGFQILVRQEDASIASPDRNQAVYHILHHAQVVFDLKTEIYEAVCREKTTERLLGCLMQMEMPESLRGAVLERILAEI